MHALHFVCPLGYCLQKSAERDLMKHSDEKMLKENRCILNLSQHRSDQSNCFAGKSFDSACCCGWNLNLRAEPF